MNSIKKISILFLTVTVFGFSSIVYGTTYNYELSVDKPWSDSGSTDSNGSTVTVRSYVPGSNSVTYKTITIYTPIYTSGANALGDVVGTTFSIYGSGNTAFVDPYDGPKRTVVFPAVQILHTKLLEVNDDRLAVGNYHVLGGHATGRGFIYDIIYDQYTSFVAPNTEWTDLADINNLGQIVGTSINDNGSTRKGFVYDCQNGFELIDVPGSSWTVPQKIDDEGNIYGSVSGITDAVYFIARPDSINSNLSCLLVPRDDTTEPVVFSGGTSFEMSGDIAQGVKIGDFDGGGLNDLLVYHEPGKTILYIGEANFEDKIKYYGDEFNTLTQGVNIKTEWDFNNDGLIDKVQKRGSDNSLYFAKADGSYYYVPQKLQSGNLKFGDLNGDGLVDFATFSGAYASITYQVTQSVVDLTPTPVVKPTPDVVPTPIVEPTPDVEPTPVTDGPVPTKDGNAKKVEQKSNIAEIRENSVLLTSGKELWFNSESIIKFNDASGFEVGQKLEFKAWKNPDGTLIAIKVEVI